MTAAAARLRGIGARQIRIVCGLILFSYIVSHFLNHALGNVSLAAMDAGALYHIALWQYPPVAFVFYAAVAIHLTLGLYALYQRREFSWRALEPLQLALGLSIPALIVSHVVAVRLGQVLFDHQKLYPQAVYAYWVAWPLRHWLMDATLIAAWAHGCIGLFFWLRYRPWFNRAAPYLLTVAVLIPTVSLLGLYQAGRAVRAVARSPDWIAENLSRVHVGAAADQSALDSITDYLLAGYLALIAAVLLARVARGIFDRRKGVITLTYGNGRTVRVPVGLSVLEASLRHKVPHASMCGGRARCSTCRIRIMGDVSALPAPSRREAFVLERVGASHDPAVRLACQLRPRDSLAFVQVFTPQPDGAVRLSRSGQERYLVSMFVDMRGSTRLAESKLPFDTVFVVNRFLEAVSHAVVEAGGRPNQFVGDGQLALFGLDCEPAEACRRALRAAVAIGRNVDALNVALAHDLAEPLRFGIGIHGGEVIVGDIGDQAHRVFTAIGDPVNVAARLQEVTKALACEVVWSEHVHALAGFAGDLPLHRIAIRGRVEAMEVRAADVVQLAGIAHADAGPITTAA